jgi:hypothetical protein
MSSINPPYEPTNPRKPPQPGATRMSVLVYCDVNLVAFARDIGIDDDEPTALSMAQADVREWAADMIERLNASPKWQGVGTWGIK